MKPVVLKACFVIVPKEIHGQDVRANREKENPKLVGKKEVAVIDLVERDV